MDKTALLVFAGGVLAGVLFLGFLLTATGANLSSWDFVREFQTLIAGLAAFGGAVLTVIALYSQINAEKKRYADAARAALPNYLSNVSGYAEDCMLIASQYVRLIRSRHSTSSPSRAASPDAPTLDTATVMGIANAAAVTQPPLGGNLFSLLHWYQIQSTRLQDLVIRFRAPTVGNLSREPSVIEAENVIKDAARLHLLADRFYEPARAGVDYRAGVTPEDIDRRIRFILGH